MVAEKVPIVHATIERKQSGRLALMFGNSEVVGVTTVQASSDGVRGIVQVFFDASEVFFTNETAPGLH